LRKSTVTLLGGCFISMRTPEGAVGCRNSFW
jgi:hypothetical protein